MCGGRGTNESHFFIEYLPHDSDMSEIDPSQPIEMPMAFIFMEAGGTSTQAVLTASGKVNAVHWYRVVPAVEGPTRETLGYIGTNVRSS